MKTDHFLKGYKDKLKLVREHGKNVMMSHMVMDNIADLIPPELEMKHTWWTTGVSITPRTDADGKELPFPADKFDKLIAKLARVLNTQPTMIIEKNKMDGTFWLYPKMLHEYHGSVVVEVTIGNSEACDIEMVDQVVQVPQLTGYCKALAEKKYMTQRQSA